MYINYNFACYFLFWWKTDLLPSEHRFSQIRKEYKRVYIEYAVPSLRFMLTVHKICDSQLQQLDHIHTNAIKSFLRISLFSADVPSWLKSLRLHKYQGLFQQMSYEEMLTLTEDDLERMVSVFCFSLGTEWVRMKGHFWHNILDQSRSNSLKPIMSIGRSVSQLSLSIKLVEIKTRHFYIPETRISFPADTNQCFSDFPCLSNQTWIMNVSIISSEVEWPMFISGCTNQVCFKNNINVSIKWLIIIKLSC